MDSITTSTSPESTLSPGFAFTCHTVPVISDLTSIRAMTLLGLAGFRAGRESRGAKEGQYSIGPRRSFPQRDARKRAPPVLNACAIHVMVGPLTVVSRLRF